MSPRRPQLGTSGSHHRCSIAREAATVFVAVRLLWPQSDRSTRQRDEQTDDSFHLGTVIAPRFRFGDVAVVLIQLRACQAALIRPVGRGAPRAPVWRESGVLRGLGRSLRRSDGELHADALRCSDRSGEGAREVIRAGLAVAKSTSLASVPSLDQGTRFLPITK